MNNGITKQDRKNVKNTAIIFSVIFVICTILSAVLGFLIPPVYEMKTLGANKEEIVSQINGKDGSDYFLLTDYSIYRFDALTDEKISTFSLSEITEELQKQGDYDCLVSGSLNQWGAKYVEGLEKDYYIVYDGNGNIFKLEDDGVNLHMTDDYYLSSEKNVVKGCDNVGADMYALTENENEVCVRQFDFNNLSSGAQKQKALWDISLTSDKEGYTTIKRLDKIGIWGLFAAEDVMYILYDGGRMIKLSLDMADNVIDGQTWEFFSSAKQYLEDKKQQENDETYQQIFAEVYEREYAEYFKDEILKIKDSDKNPIYTENDLKGKTSEELVAIFESHRIPLLVDQVKTKAHAAAYETAKNAAEEKSGVEFMEEPVWYGGYNEEKGELFVKNEYLNDEYYSIVGAGDGAINGAVYSKKNKALYYANASDGYLYTVEKEGLDKAKIGSFFSDISTRIDAISCGKNKQFSSFGNGLGYNEFANTLYLKYENKNIISIVDINDKENYRTIYTFETDYNLYSLAGDKDNQVTHVLRTVSKVSLKGELSTTKYACTYEPVRAQHTTTIRTAFIVFLVLAAITLLLACWFFIGTKKERELYRIKTIQRDFIKNKWVYLSLVFFVVLLILFCYYEAIGAISMSFFDYTNEQPAWIWNNFGHYLKIFNDANFWKSLGNMVFFLLFDLMLGIIPPLIFAFLLTIIRNKTISNWIRAMMFIPGIIPGMATMLIWREGIYGAEGIINQLLGTDIVWQWHATYSRWALIFMGFPFVGGYLIFYGGMINIPSEYHEAGRLEGLGIIKQFLLIDIPLISPQIKYIFVTTFIASAQNYARTYVLQADELITPVHRMYEEMTKGNYGMSSAYATILFLLLFAAVATNFKMQRKENMGEDL